MNNPRPLFLHLECPYCGAERNEVCKSIYTGKPLTDSHISRQGETKYGGSSLLSELTTMVLRGNI